MLDSQNADIFIRMFFTLLFALAKAGFQVSEIAFDSSVQANCCAPLCRAAMHGMMSPCPTGNLRCHQKCRQWLALQKATAPTRVN